MDEIRRYRVGCVPYLNAKPLVQWLDDNADDKLIELSYDVPSRLAEQLNGGSLDVALVSIFELFQNPDLKVIPNISISADGPVRSVRLFSRVPLIQIETVALDSSSLTSVALTRVILAEKYSLFPKFISAPPNLALMLRDYDAGLIIGDLSLFNSPVSEIVDMGEEWKDMTGLPFCYAAWLASPEVDTAYLSIILSQSKAWGIEHLTEVTSRWSIEMGLDLPRVREYFYDIMKYDLDEPKLQAISLFKSLCQKHKLIPE